MKNPVQHYILNKANHVLNHNYTYFLVQFQTDMYTLLVFLYFYWRWWKPGDVEEVNKYMEDKIINEKGDSIIKINKINIIFL